MRKIKTIGLLIILSIISIGCLKERNCGDFNGVSSRGNRKYQWVSSIYYNGTDSALRVYAHEFSDQYEFEIFERNPGNSWRNRNLFYLRQNNIEILRFRPICNDFQHLIDPFTGKFTDGYIYYFNSEDEMFELRAMGLDSLKIRYPFPEADNVYERID